MILITKIEYLKTEQSYAQLLYETSAPDRHVCTFSGAVVPTDLVRQHLCGRRFTSSDGTDIVLGITNEASEALSMQIERQQVDYDKLCRKVEDLQRAGCLERERHADTLVEITSASFWHRLRYLFTRKL
jgi:hypothetical protein